MGRMKRFDVFLISLNPSRGAEMRKIRPCLVVSTRRDERSHLQSYRRPNEVKRPQIPHPGDLSVSRSIRTDRTRPNSHRGQKATPQKTGKSFSGNTRSSVGYFGRNVREVPCSAANNSSGLPGGLGYSAGWRPRRSRGTRPRPSVFRGGRSRAWYRSPQPSCGRGLHWG